MNKLLLFLTSTMLMSSSVFAMEKENKPRIQRGPAHQIWCSLFPDDVEETAHPMWSSVLAHIGAAMAKVEIPEHHLARLPIAEMHFPDMEKKLKNMADNIVETRADLKFQRRWCEENLGKQWGGDRKRLYVRHSFPEADKSGIEDLIRENKDKGLILDQIKIEDGLFCEPKTAISNTEEIKNLFEIMISLRDQEAQLLRVTKHLQQQKAEARRIQAEQKASLIAQNAREETARIQKTLVAAVTVRAQKQQEGEALETVSAKRLQEEKALVALRTQKQQEEKALVALQTQKQQEEKVLKALHAQMQLEKEAIEALRTQKRAIRKSW